MLSSPMGLGQQGAAVSVSVMVSVSMTADASELITVANAPNVCGCVAVTEKTVVEPKVPVKVYGIAGARIQIHRSEAEERPLAVTVTCPVTDVPAAAMNWMNGAGFP